MNVRCLSPAPSQLFIQTRLSQIDSYLTLAVKDIFKTSHSTHLKFTHLNISDYVLHLLESDPTQASPSVPLVKSRKVKTYAKQNSSC